MCKEYLTSTVGVDINGFVSIPSSIPPSLFLISLLYLFPFFLLFLLWPSFPLGGSHDVGGGGDAFPLSLLDETLNECVTMNQSHPRFSYISHSQRL